MSTPIKCKHQWAACEWGKDSTEDANWFNLRVVTKVFCIHCLTKKAL